MNTVEEVTRDVAVTGGHELRAEGGAGEDNLGVVADGLDGHAEHLVGQRMTAAVHDLLYHVNDHVDLLDVLVTQHVGVGGDVVGQVGAVTRFYWNTLSVLLRNICNGK